MNWGFFVAYNVYSLPDCKSVLYHPDVGTAKHQCGMGKIVVSAAALALELVLEGLLSTILIVLICVCIYGNARSCAGINMLISISTQIMQSRKPT